MDDEGALGRVGPVTDYPVYATALAVRAWIAGDRPVPAAAAAWLVSRQLTVETGWRDHPAEGGFDMGGHTGPL